MANVINWFEIPVTDMDRAVKFYSEILNGKIETSQMGGTLMGFLPMEGQGVGGALIKHENYKPSSDGTIVYLNAVNGLGEYANRIEPAGGKVLVPSQLVTEEIGYVAVFLDTEGNKVAFHSSKK
jgi:uncharacterized protein